MEDDREPGPPPSQLAELATLANVGFWIAFFVGAWSGAEWFSELYFGYALMGSGAFILLGLNLLALLVVGFRGSESLISVNLGIFLSCALLAQVLPMFGVLSLPVGT